MKKFSYEKLIEGIKRSRVGFIGIGYFDTIVYTETGAGIVSTLKPLKTQRGMYVKQAGSLVGKENIELVKMIFSDNPLEISIGFATLNASLEIPRRYSLINAADIIRQEGKGKRIGIIGHFPFVDELKREGYELLVFELNPSKDDIPVSEIPRLLPKCEVVAITSMTLLNRTFSEILEHIDRNALKILLGPSTPLSPYLFEFVDILSGALIIDRETVKRYVLEGASYRHIKEGLKRVSVFKNGFNA